MSGGYNSRQQNDISSKSNSINQQHQSKGLTVIKKAARERERRGEEKRREEKRREGKRREEREEEKRREEERRRP